jgi:hypothetical protein
MAARRENRIGLFPQNVLMQLRWTVPRPRRAGIQSLFTRGNAVIGVAKAGIRRQRTGRAD